MIDKNIRCCETCQHRVNDFTPCPMLVRDGAVLINPCPAYKKDEWIWENRENIQFDSSDYTGMVKLMDNHELYDSFVMCINQNGESMLLWIDKDRIDARVFQNNHWIRHMTYHRDGTVEETYCGRWTD